MIKLKYNKKIVLDRKRNGGITLETDRGDVYNLLQYTNIRNPVSSWWAEQNQSDLRHWQKDIVVGYAGDALGPLSLFAIYKPGQGYHQDHDICLAYSEKHAIWILATEEDYWIVNSDFGQIVFHKANTLGSVLNKDDRLMIASIWDLIKHELNPDNVCTWARY